MYNIKGGTYSSTSGSPSCVKVNIMCNTLAGYTSESNVEGSVCVCLAGYKGTVVFGGSIGNPCTTDTCASTLSGCSLCETGYWKLIGNGNNCSPIACSVIGYVGISGSCTCDVGYGGSVIYTGGNLYGCNSCTTGTWVAVAGNGRTCTTISCSLPGYAGIPGVCTCANGYSGIAIYSNGAVDGCSACPTNSWATAGNSRTCKAISCSTPGYTGSPGICICASGYTGTVSYSNGLPTGCTACSITTWSIAGVGQSCTPIPCISTNYTGTSGACTCASGYSGTSVTYFNGLPTGCTQCTNGKWAPPGIGQICTQVACSGAGYTEKDKVCVCAQDYYGTVTYSAFLSGCQKCDTGYWSDPGSIKCLNCKPPSASQNYTQLGSSRECLCAAGFNGFVTYNYNDGVIRGCVACLKGYWSSKGLNNACTAVNCSGSAYNGTAGSCTCQAGFQGIVTYTGGILGGCTACNSGKWAKAGNGNICAAIPCSYLKGYSGIPGFCSCRVGYTGSVVYLNGILDGCKAIPCSTTGYTGVAGDCMCQAGYEGNVSYTNTVLEGCTKCGKGFWASAGNGQRCSAISCNSNLVGYIGPAGNCACATGYYGNVEYINGTVSGCFAVLCTSPAFDGLPGNLFFSLISCY